MPQKSFFFAFLVYFYINTKYIKLDRNSENFLIFWCTLLDTHILLCLNICTRFPVVQIASGTRSESMFFVLLPMLLWGRVKISEHASAAARACCNYSIPGVKHITEQITEISFNFDVQFVQAAPRPGI